MKHKDNTKSQEKMVAMMRAVRHKKVARLMAQGKVAEAKKVMREGDEREARGKQ